MNEIEIKIKALFVELSDSVGSDLDIETGICALYDQDGHEAAIIEIPKNSEMIILHCELFSVNEELTIEAYQQIMQQNFLIGDMKGCWFALEGSSLKLCTKRFIADMNGLRFCHLVNGFIQQGKEWREKFPQLLATKLDNPLSPWLAV
ncbi:CesT family type III secretion system chaperone [Shewanella sp. VB17]|uniref:type III secretion system chaperone n=1 Tax=Shewanella sp. VB17 TaxID=2739432 RepID=UPI0015657F46|nr:type III secretion system chaperone [Shewanella sp. VB17]NRD75709.1 CesT family type III secretion system chaperone [Shewanella sp. VB17]